MKPNFHKINIKEFRRSTMSSKEWKKDYKEKEEWLSPEQIPVKPVFTREDL